MKSKVHTPNVFSERSGSYIVVHVFCLEIANFMNFLLNLNNNNEIQLNNCSG